MNIHQLSDEFWDRVAGVRTFANLGGPVEKLSCAAFAAETGFLLATLIMAWPHSKFAAAALAAWAVSAALLRGRMLSLRGRLLSYRDAPLAGYYFLALPMALIMGAVPAIQTSRAGILVCPALAVAAARWLVLFRKRQLGRKQRLGPIGPAGGDAAGHSPTEETRGTNGSGLEPAREAALTWIQTRQTPAGGYNVLSSVDPKFGDAMELRCVFDTALVARLLEPWARREDVASTLQRCRDFLKAEREPSGLWRYFGRGSVIAADVDDTACCLLVLPPDGSESAILDRILRNSDTEGSILTWFLDRGDEPPYRNGVDAAVNANVYMLLRQRGIEPPAILGQLLECLFRRHFLQGTAYYPSPFYFLYALSRVSDHLNSEVVARIEKEALELLTSPRVTGVMETAQACSTLASCGTSPAVREPLLKRILATQLADGGWAPEPLTLGMNRVRYYYGSRAVTTAFCLEALATAEGVSL
jgi:hypothetical protein